MRFGAGGPGIQLGNGAAVLGVGMPLLMKLPRPGEVPMPAGYGAAAAPVGAAREPGSGGP